jgi:DME family drug/metabolite transporter
MALVPMLAGYVLFGWGLAHVPASTATTLSLLEPAVAAVLAVLVVGELLPAAGWMGIALVIACLAVLTAPTPTRHTRGQVRNNPLDHDSSPPRKTAGAVPGGEDRTRHS